LDADANDAARSVEARAAAPGRRDVAGAEGNFLVAGVQDAVEVVDFSAVLYARGRVASCRGRWLVHV
jgi:hypothetical protein